VSILLEALRKSEKNQRSAETPTIHTDQQAPVETGRARKLILAVLLLIVLILAAWIVWREFGAPDEAYQPPVALPAKQDDGSKKNTIKKSTIKTPMSALQKSDAAAGAGKSDVKKQRTPVENYKHAAADTGKKNQTRARTTRAGTNKTDTSEAKTSQPKTTQAKKGKSSTAKPKSKPANSVAKINNVPAEKSAAKVSDDKKQPQPISYWELPDAVRAEVPEIKFSVLVFATKPADRFVLADGQRLAEGDSYSNGLVVEEIRRDGVVFSYRKYRFLIAR